MLLLVSPEAIAFGADLCFTADVLFFYSRQQNASHVLAMACASAVCLSVRLTVRLSATLLYCIKHVQTRITKSLLKAALRTLVFL